MTAKELDTMVRTMREYGAEIKSRSDVEQYAYCLRRGLMAIKRNDLADQLWQLYDEMDSIETLELMDLKTFCLE